MNLRNQSGLFAFAVLICVAVCSTLFTGQLSSAQGVLIPDDGQEHRHPHFRIPRPHLPPIVDRDSYRIKELSIDATIKDQIAQTQVTQMFENMGRRQMEVSFVFPLPYDGAIDQLTFLVDGKELQAKLLPADKAREIYEGYVRRYKDPALLEWIGTGMFKTSVFPVPAGATRTVSLKYSQLLKKDRKTVDYLFPLSTAKYTAKPIEKVSFRLAIQSGSPIKNIYSPTHDVKVERDDDRNAVVSVEAKNNIPVNDFRLLYDTDDRKIGASVVSFWPEDEDQGYFVLLASPEIKKSSESESRKNILFVVDRSGSMNGKKIVQARDAAKFVLNNLNENDLFNVIAYDSEIQAFAPELQRYNEESRSSALGFINSINSGGSTNIDGALAAALKNIKDDSLPNYIVFLTDGRPTVGEVNEMKIVENTKTHNKHGARLISFGVGYDVNSRLIDRLSNANHGQSEYVGPDQDIEASVSRLYEKIASPVLTDAAVSYNFDVMDVEQGEIVNRVYPKEALDIFAGGQLIIVGRYKESGTAEVKLTGRIGKDTKTYGFEVQFADKGQHNSNGFVEKLWATRRIGQIIDEIDLNGHNDELVKELIQLSMKHGIMTRYTSFLADENADANALSDVRANFGAAVENLKALEATGGRRGFAQRIAKQSFKSADRTGTFGAAGGGGGLAPAPSGGGGAYFEDQVALSVSGIRTNKSGTVYKRGKTVIAANATDVDLEKQKNEIVEVERYSKDYFDLVAANSKTENEILAEQLDDEELIIRLRGKIYRIK